ncbi:Na/Pi symporter [uncultured Alteromonas sp.]|jgi:sodium-dependent phosphate cotransporter|uniref:Na/Pi symporter n=1 Tax=uncultured Alteromonas sp. TaxID=179113 RepID=UPI00258D54CF|nr:Na/Pi symporter [uncultured Alteromonas sp.]|tara:strand:+ start:4542 stop:5693 length:1152 start_codon:yes stop_codon:yes gene_type:complete
MSLSDSPLVCETETQHGNWRRWLLLIALVYLMLLAVSMIGSGFKLAAGDHAKTLFTFASNPIMGLIIGMVATALIQSSSTVTSIIVGMVAGGLPITIAVPMMMGANIGTSITNTLVSLGHVAKKDEFQRAFNAATIHDFFNVMSVIIFLPLEMAFGILEHSSAFVVSMLNTGGTMGVDGFNPIKALTQPALNIVTGMVSGLPSVYPGIAKIILGIGLIVTSITYMGKIMKSLMVGKAKDILHKSIGKGPISGISSGALMTVLVQSSSTTTSLVVPLVGSGILKAKDIYPFTLGANIGTCITALIAALGVVGVNAAFALQIALVHLLYNVFSVVLIYGTPMLRNIPLDLSYKLSVIVAEKKFYGVAYIGGLFFCMPLGIIFMSV